MYTYAQGTATQLRFLPAHVSLSPYDECQIKTHRLLPNKGFYFSTYPPPRAKSAQRLKSYHAGRCEMGIVVLSRARCS